MKGASAEGRKKTNQMLNQVQHDMTVRFWSSCHPEPGPELNSGSTISRSLFWFKNLGVKAPPCGRGSLINIEKAELKQAGEPVFRGEFQ
jgi:hypothetical protein